MDRRRFLGIAGGAALAALAHEPKIAQARSYFFGGWAGPDPGAEATRFLQEYKQFLHTKYHEAITGNGTREYDLAARHGSVITVNTHQYGAMLKVPEFTNHYDPSDPTLVGSVYGHEVRLARPLKDSFS